MAGLWMGRTWSGSSGWYQQWWRGRLRCCAAGRWVSPLPGWPLLLEVVGKDGHGANTVERSWQRSLLSVVAVG